jgi:hypothetical protein|tara:strand:+ start:95 stop:418 length:324 start_codon:yes stop_codon:yes gene_type:complete
MANTFKNQGAAITTAGAIVYTAPAATQSVIHSCYISNIDGTSSADVSIKARATSGDTYYHVAKTVPVPADSTLVLDKPIDLEATGDVFMTSSATGDLEVVMGILEIT